MRWSRMPPWCVSSTASWKNALRQRITAWGLASALPVSTSLVTTTTLRMGGYANTVPLSHRKGLLKPLKLCQAGGGSSHSPFSWSALPALARSARLRFFHLRRRRDLTRFSPVSTSAALRTSCVVSRACSGWGLGTSNPAKWRRTSCRRARGATGGGTRTSSEACSPHTSTPAASRDGFTSPCVSVVERPRKPTWDRGSLPCSRDSHTAARARRDAMDSLALKGGGRVRLSAADSTVSAVAITSASAMVLSGKAPSPAGARCGGGPHVPTNSLSACTTVWWGCTSTMCPTPIRSMSAKAPTYGAPARRRIRMSGKSAMEACPAPEARFFNCSVTSMKRGSTCVTHAVYVSCPGWIRDRPTGTRTTCFAGGAMPPVPASP